MILKRLGYSDDSGEQVAVLYRLFHVFECLPKTEDKCVLPEHLAD